MKSNKDGFRVTYELKDDTVVPAEDFVKTDEQDKKIIELFYEALGYEVTFAEN